MRKSTLKKIIRKLEKENIKLIAECNAARARAGEAWEIVEDQRVTAGWSEDRDLDG